MTAGFAFGAFIGEVVFVAIILAVALMGPALAASGWRGTLGVIWLAILSAIVGGSVASYFAPAVQP
jgi:hypothetical protein